MAAVGKDAIQFPAEDEFDDCPDATSDDVPSPEVLDTTIEVVSSKPSPNGGVLVNGHAGPTTKETDKSRLKDNARVVICSEDDDDDSDDDEDDGDKQDANGTSNGVKNATNDKWKIEDGESITCECFICDHTTIGYEGADLMKSHVESFHGLSFEKLKTRFRLDYPSFVQFVRWAREQKQLGIIQESVDKLWTLPSSPADELPWLSDKYLLPPSESPSSKPPVDYFLTLDYFAMEDNSPDGAVGGYDMNELVQEIGRLQSDMNRMSAVFKRVISASVDGLEDVPGKKVGPSIVKQGSTPRTPNVSPNRDHGSPKKSPTMSLGSADDLDNHNKWYFESYDEASIHHDMIFDHARTDAYRAAIIDRSEDIKGKVVMDLGCGTGILSMFCAQQGAAVVHCVDKSNIIFDAISNCYENNFDRVMKFHHKDLDNDDTTDLEKEGKVDVLVSEFMGYFLFFEGMTESFIRARDKYLKPDGILMPDTCIVELAPIGPSGLYESKVRCWDSVYDLKMPAMKTRVIKEPLIELVQPEDIIGNRVQVKELNLRKCRTTDVFICEDFEFVFNKETEFCGIVGFFSVEFNGATKKITLPTSPWDTPTHWKQTVFFFPSPFKVSKGDWMRGSIKCCTHKDDKRWLIVLIELADRGNFIFEIK